jgi:hypothetical protein
MSESQFGNQVRHHLNQGLDLDAAAAERLRRARELALQRQRPELAPALRWADNVLGGFGGWGGASLRVLLPVALLVLAVLFIYNWQQTRTIAEVEEIDALLLTDELPIDAYLDRGFQSWLKKRDEDE